MIAHLRNNVVAYLALFVAIGGTSYAAAQLPKDSVSSKQIAKNAVRSAEVKDGSLKKTDLASGVLPTAAWARDNGFVVAPTNTTLLHTITTLTVPSPGRLLVWGRMSAASPQQQFDCPGNTVNYELFVDGVPVPGTFIGTDVAFDNGDVQFNHQGVTTPVSAGAHKIQVGAMCSDNTPTAVAVGAADIPVVGAMLVGS